MACKDLAREVLGIPCSESSIIEGRIGMLLHRNVRSTWSMLVTHATGYTLM